jgi:sugar phosphate isomerase/epimerase
MQELPIALQLYTVRDELQRDFAGTVRQVAEIGYPAVEFAGYGGLSAPQMAVLLRETGLQAASTHVSLDAVRNDLDGQIAYCREIGCSSMMLAWLAPAERGADRLAALAEQLNRAGRQCREAGISFGYHNHDFEFESVDAKPLLERLMEQTDPANVTFELDVYWTAFAGVDPVAFLRQHRDRISLLHMKDMDAQRSYAEVGEGMLDIRRICEVGQEIGVRWYVVEHDAPKMPSLQSARVSLENLQSILGRQEIAHGR